MAEQVRPVDQPFKVMTSDGTFLDGFPTRAEAQVRAVEANKAAKALGLSIRYGAEEGARSSDPDYSG